MPTDLTPTTAPTAGALDGTERIPCTQGLVPGKALTPALIADYLATIVFARLQADNLRLDNNTLSSTDTDGAVIIDPDGTGPLRLASGLFQMGGTSASFPALKQNGSDLEVRLADDSNYGLLTARYLCAIAADGSYRFKAQADIGALLAAAGQLLWSSASGLGGVSTGDTGIKRDSAGVQLDTNGSSGLGARLTGRVVEASTSGSGAPNLLAATESRKLLTNEGSTAENYHTLPSAAPGIEFVFVCQDADGIRIVANTGDTIRLGGAVSAAAGFIRAAVIGNAVTLAAINNTEWIATSIVGTWTIDL